MRSGRKQRSWAREEKKGTIEILGTQRALTRQGNDSKGADKSKSSDSGSLLRATRRHFQQTRFD